MIEQEEIVEKLLQQQSTAKARKFFLRGLFAPGTLDNIRQVMVTLFGQGFRSSTTFFTGLLVARFCSIAEYGLFVVAFTTVILMANIQETLIGIPYYVFRPRRTGRFSHIYQLSVAIWQALLAVASACIMAGIGYFALVRGYEFGRLLIFTSPVVAAVMIRDFLRQSCFARLKPAQVLWIDIPIAFLQIGFIVLFAFAGRLNSENALWIIGITALIICLMPFFLMLRDRDALTLRYFLRTGYRHITFGRWTILSRITYWCALGSYPFVITIIAGPEETAIFGACQGIPLLFNPVLLALNNFMLPKFSHNISNIGLVSLFHSIKKMTVIITGGMILFTIIIVMFGKDILSLIYGQKYLAYTLPLIILSIAVLISEFSMCLDVGFVALKRPWFGVIVYGLAALIALPVGILACIRHGANGAAVGYLIGAVIVTTTRWTLFRNIKKKFALNM